MPPPQFTPLPIKEALSNIRELSLTFFLNQLNLKRFQMQSLTSCTGALARLNPIEPALALHMSSIDDVIMLGEISRQFYFNGLNSKRLPRSAGNFSIFDPLLPTDVLNMSSILDVTGISKVGLTNRQRLNSKISTSCAAVMPS